MQKRDGTIVITVRLTFKPGRDDQLIEYISSAPPRALAAFIREAMRSGIPDTSKVIPLELNHFDETALLDLAIDL